jgi:hypothetical protein
MDANKLSSISQTDTDEKIGEFWDNHDFTDFDDPNAPDIEFEISCTVSIEVELFIALEKQAHKRGVQVETLVNLWLQQKLNEQIENIAV